MPANRHRRTFKVWEECKCPDLVIEVTSRKTRTEDTEQKLELYRDVLKVREYFLFDPLEEYLEPSLVISAMTSSRCERGRLLLFACAVVAVGARIATWAASPGPQDDDLARELPRIKPLEPAAALESFRIHAGFRLEPVAVEPLVTDPVSVCYDADGRLYVVEMRGYPFPEKTPSGNVTRLEDRDGDGRFETRTIFLDGLSWPTGIVPYDGGVFIAVAPDIIYAKDTNGDGVADVKKVMFTGFGTDNVQGLLNGLLWGPDGWIYGVTSSNGGTIHNRSRPDAKPVSVRGRDFRFKPDGSAFEAISGGGQFGHSFDDWGHRFTCNNSNHVRQIVLPSHYLERNPALIPPPAVLDIAAEGPAAPVFRISPPEPWRVVRTRQRAADPVLSRRLPADGAVRHRFLHLGDRRHDLSRLGLSARISRQCVRGRRRRQPRPSQGPLGRRRDLSRQPGRRERRVSRVDRQLVSAGQLRQHARWDVAHHRHVPRDDRASVLDTRTDQEASRPDQRQGPRPAL